LPEPEAPTTITQRFLVKQAPLQSALEHRRPSLAPEEDCRIA
jgi:hypothetical protein